MDGTIPRRLTLAGAVVISFALAACGSDADAEAEVMIEVAQGELGPHLVDGLGMTLYLFTEDAQGPSVCADACASNWPPLLTDDGAATGGGIDDSLVATTTREDGSEQLTYNGWPLYHWAGDDAPGEVTGQGVQGVWYVVSPDGDAITTAMDSDAATEDPEEDRGSGAYEY